MIDTKSNFSSFTALCSVLPPLVIHEVITEEAWRSMVVNRLKFRSPCLLASATL